MKKIIIKKMLAASFHSKNKFYFNKDDHQKVVIFEAQNNKCSFCLQKKGENFCIFFRASKLNFSLLQCSILLAMHMIVLALKLHKFKEFFIPLNKIRSYIFQVEDLHKY